MKSKFKAVLVTVLILTFIAPMNTYAAPRQIPLQAPCKDGFDHHSTVGSPYFDRLATSTTLWQSPNGLDVIVAVRIAECGKYLIGIWRNGEFTTHFLTSWGYVLAQVKGFTRSTWARFNLVARWQQMWLLFIILPCPGTTDMPPCPTSQG